MGGSHENWEKYKVAMRITSTVLGLSSLTVIRLFRFFFPLQESQQR